MPIHVIWMSGSKVVAYRGKDYVKSAAEEIPGRHQRQLPTDLPET